MTTPNEQSSREQEIRVRATKMAHAGWTDVGISVNSLQMILRELLDAFRPALSGQTAESGEVSDERIDEVFEKWSGANSFGCSYLQSYKEGFRPIARAILALSAPQEASKPAKEPVAEGEGFWQWLPKAYRDSDANTSFTAYNMEVAFEAGRAMPSDLEIQAVEELAQIGYTVRDGLLYPPKDGLPAPQALSDEAPEWATCETRGPWVRNSLKARIGDLRDGEKMCRRAYKKEFMGEPTKWYADALGEAAAVLERKLSAIQAAIGGKA